MLLKSGSPHVAAPIILLVLTVNSWLNAGPMDCFCLVARAEKQIDQRGDIGNNTL